MILRIVTAVFMLVILIPVIFFAPQALWGAVSLVILALAFREWSALLPGPRPRWWLWALGLSLGAYLVILESSGRLPFALSGALCGLALVFWVVWAPRRLSTHRCHGGGRPLALLLLAACWLALLELRSMGTWSLISAMAIVWVADVAAYFAGRMFGRRKLAPEISPGKSWEGVLGGMLAVAALGIWSAGLPSMAGTLPHLLVTVTGPWAAAPVLAALAGLSVVGDLHESLLKRVAGVKDSGRLLPGHGGFLDRIDALVPTMPAVVLMHQVLR